MKNLVTLRQGEPAKTFGRMSARLHPRHLRKQGDTKTVVPSLEQRVSVTQSYEKTFSRKKIDNYLSSLFSTL